MFQRRKIRKVSERAKRSKSIFRYSTILCVCCCICILAVFLLVQLIYIFSIKINKLDNTNIFWNKNAQINVLVADISSNNLFSNISILSLNQSEVIEVQVPSSVYLNDNSSYIQIKSIYALSSLQQNANAIGILEKDIRNNMYINTDAYLLFKNKDENILNNYSKYTSIYVMSHIGTIHTMLNNDIYSNLDQYSIYNIDSYMRSGVKISTINPSSTDLSTFSQGEYINTQSFSQDISSQFIDSYLQNEHARISIYNGSGVVGRANLLANILQNEGGIIDHIGTLDNPVAHTQIHSKSAGSFIYTINKLKTMLSAQVINSSYTDTSDVSIVIGEDSKL